MSPRGHSSWLPKRRESPGGRQDAVLPHIQRPVPTALLVPGGFLGAGSRKGHSSAAGAEQLGKKTAKTLFFSSPVSNTFSLRRG